jgi:hypothetical protein
MPGVPCARYADRDGHLNRQPLLDGDRLRVAGAGDVRADQSVYVDHDDVAHDLGMVAELE